jgi:hypothetical protein
MTRPSDRRRPEPVTVPWSAVAGTALTAVAYLVVWLAPTLDLELTRALITAFFLEFFILHAGLMVPAARSVHPARGFLVAAVYLLAGVGVGIGLGPWAFVSFCYLTLTEILPALRAKGDDLVTTAIAGGGKAALYFVVLVPAMLLPVPRLGITEAIENELAIGLRGIGDPGPQNVLLAGVVFFAVLAYVRAQLARGSRSTRATGQT